MEAETQCCPPFDPTPWDETTLDFAGKWFVQDRVRSFFHIPLNFGAVMTRMMDLVLQAQAKPGEQIILSDETSLWGSEVYVYVTKEVPGARMRRIEGRYFSKAFDGPYGQIGRFCKEMNQLLAAKGFPQGHFLFGYPLCPKCAKKYGHNPILILSRTDGGA
ncbi:MAG: hypothetical protein A2600_08110 [Candidatus Lambdaproteobacteria bacterium RIFOXYD1_FULL_56_27]|uniref:Uncharacterized protein n=1 Tax=Candidatus Lambdaproteobacteria bacterium RIFOXYD2_FULL_56_26 TaxID=1817773 RepID=A0A1F6GVT5_9PROT|nr:MAG: hypothetical protein A2557_05185 [Candidatus Lambdaproteobacteria bacterium RIFOXYD2_FULL_56_26]OGH03274.1 MAG: hypothetical protein A2426_06905 [Candidatus Lambdaproteobacteria bacterium RIFOXYC1_FULL_56_13]OGH07472.1 MAG: hypothetical protein A2600_08110 [Candidatus Lambdaproteobacteria bacterium RIFOXYD1_FULL_56_27]